MSETQTPDTNIVFVDEPAQDDTALTGEQTAQEEHVSPETGDNQTENPAPQSEDASQSEAVAEEDVIEPQGENAKPDAEAEEAEKKAKMEHALKVQAYKNRQLKRELEDLKKQQQTAQNTQATIAQTNGDKPPRMPNMADPEIEYDEEKYQKALQEWQDKSFDYKFRQREQQEKQKKAEQEQQSRAARFAEQYATLAAEDPQYAELTEASAQVQFSDAVRDTILSSENAAKLHREIVRNPKRMEELNSMQPVLAMRELVKLELSLNSEAPKQASSPRKVTQAPQPVSVTKGVSFKGDGIPKGMKFDY